MIPGIDRDYPMTRRQVAILVVGLAVMAAVGITLFGGFLPGIHPNLSTDITSIRGIQYYDEFSALHDPLFSNSTSPWNVSFHNVTFELWLTNWYSGSGGVVHGVGTEPNGSAYAFVLGTVLPNGTREQLYLSPDLDWGAWWAGGIVGGFWVQLYVRM